MSPNNIDWRWWGSGGSTRDSSTEGGGGNPGELLRRGGMETGLGGPARFQQLVVRRGKSISGSPRPSLWSPSPGASPLPPSPAHPPAHIFLLKLMGRSSAPAALLGLACLLSLCAGASRSFKPSHVVSLTCWHQRQLCVYRFQRKPSPEHIRETPPGSTATVLEKLQMWLGGLWKPRQAGEGSEPLQGPRWVRLQPRGSTTHLHRGGFGGPRSASAMGRWDLLGRFLPGAPGLAPGLSLQTLCLSSRKNGDADFGHTARDVPLWAF